MPVPEDLPIPIEFIDLGRTTETNLEDRDEPVVNDIWYDSEPRYLLAPWTGKTVLFLRHLKHPPRMQCCQGDFIVVKRGSDRPPGIHPRVWQAHGPD